MSVAEPQFSLSYHEFIDRRHFLKEELLAFAYGNLVKDPPKEGIATLPRPPFLMFDRIIDIERQGRSGTMIAEQDVSVDGWYFQCHFGNDPVQPGCLGVDALWQLLGFYCACNGAKGSGRALGAGAIEFLGQIRPFDKIVRYELTIKRFTFLKETGAAIVIADGKVFVDHVEIYTAEKLKVGVFRDIAYDNYPNPHHRYARGGLLER